MPLEKATGKPRRGRARGRGDKGPVGRVPVFADSGPFDIIGDVHGCWEELSELVKKLGYNRAGVHPEGRRLVFLGDLADRGPMNVKVLQFVTTLFFRRLCLYTPGNHCDKLYRWLSGRPVQTGHGLADTIAELNGMDPGERRRLVSAFRLMFETVPPYLILDFGRLVVVHAGIMEHMIGYISPRIRRFCLYGDPTGKRDEKGRPIRRQWALEYRGSATVVFGHDPVPEPLFVNGTVNIDQGCVFGGHLTAYRYPEGTIVQVRAKRVYNDSRIDQFLSPAELAAWR